MSTCRADFEKCIKTRTDRWACDRAWQRCRVAPLVASSYSRAECEQHMYALCRDLLAKAADCAEEERAVDIARDGLDTCRATKWARGPSAAALYPHPVKTSES